MRANNLSVSIPYKGCDKSCPYCVSKMTGYMESDEGLFFGKMDKVLHMAEMSQVSSVSITGKGEPMLNLEAVKEVIRKFKNFPVELQTNGILLKKNPNLIGILASEGLDVVALSFDRIEDFETYSEVINLIDSVGMTSRVTLNVTDNLPSFDEFGFMDYINYSCKKHNVHQFSIRNIVAPNHTEWTKYHQWIEDNTKEGLYQALIDDFENEKNNGESIHFLRQLPYGGKLYDVEGISYTSFDYCIQDENNGDDIRSLIYQEDGHLYTSWNSLASRIF